MYHQAALIAATEMCLYENLQTVAVTK